MSTDRQEILEKLRFGGEPKALSLEYDIPQGFIDGWLKELKASEGVYEGSQRDLMLIQREFKKDLHKTMVKLAEITPSCMEDEDCSKMYFDFVKKLGKIHKNLSSKGGK